MNLTSGGSKSCSRSKRFYFILHSHNTNFKDVQYEIFILFSCRGLTKEPPITDVRSYAMLILIQHCVRTNSLLTNCLTLKLIFA